MKEIHVFIVVVVVQWYLIVPYCLTILVLFRILSHLFLPTHLLLTSKVRNIRKHFASIHLERLQLQSIWHSRYSIVDYFNNNLNVKNRFRLVDFESVLFS